MSAAKAGQSQYANRLVFVSAGRRGSDDLYTVDPDGSHVRAVGLPQAIQAGEVDDPSWDLGHATIAVEAKPPAPNNAEYDIFVMNANGSQLTNITNTPTENEYQPAFSPTGSRIAFMGNDFGLRTMNPDGSGITLLTTVGGRTPSWSPDGLTIAFGGVSGGIYVIPADGSTPPVSIRSSGARPRWSPSGLRILFEEFDGITTKLYTMDPTGGAVTVLLGSSVDSYFAGAWSPDGSQVAFVYQSTGILHIVNADGTGLVSLGLQVFDGGLAWR